MLLNFKHPVALAVWSQPGVMVKVSPACGCSGKGKNMSSAVPSQVLISNVFPASTPEVKVIEPLSNQLAGAATTGEDPTFCNPDAGIKVMASGEDETEPDC